MHALIVGAKQVGKSTLIDAVLSKLGCSMTGFRTKKEEGMAVPGCGSPIYFYEIGKPKAHTQENLLGYSRGQRPAVMDGAFDRMAECIRAAGNSGLIVMDEIGFMETSSPRFCDAVREHLHGNTPVLAAVKLKDVPFLNEIRAYPNCRCFHITQENRDALTGEVLAFMQAQLESAAQKDAHGGF